MQDGQSSGETCTGKVVKIGNELAVVLPAAEAARLGLQEGKSVEVRAVSEATAPASKMTHEEAMAVFKKYRGIIPADYKFNRDEANER